MTIRFGKYNKEGIEARRGCTYYSVLDFLLRPLLLVDRRHHGQLLVTEVRHWLPGADHDFLLGLETPAAALEHHDHLDFVGHMQTDLVERHLEHVLHWKRLRAFHKSSHLFLL